MTTSPHIATPIECLCHRAPHHAACPIAEAERKAAARFGPIADGIAECGLLEAYVTGAKSFATIKSPSPTLSAAITAARLWVARTGPPWLFLASHETGLAKTHVASSALAEAIRDPKDGATGRYVKLSRMILEFQDAPLGRKVETFKRFTLPRRLVLDEIGAEKASEFTIASLSQVLDERYESRRATILVSNLLLDEIGSKYSPTSETIAARRIVDRIYEMTGGKSGEGRIVLEGRSWRKR